MEASFDLLIRSEGGLKFLADGWREKVIVYLQTETEQESCGGICLVRGGSIRRYDGSCDAEVEIEIAGIYKFVRKSARRAKRQRDARNLVKNQIKQTRIYALFSADNTDAL